MSLRQRPGQFSLTVLAAGFAASLSFMLAVSAFGDSPPPPGDVAAPAIDRAPIAPQPAPASGSPVSPPATPSEKSATELAIAETHRDEPEMIDVDFSRRGTLRMILKSDALELASPYGALVIPVRDIVRIDFASRLDDADRKQLDSAISQLGNSDFDARRKAMNVIAMLGERAYPALLKASKDRDPEVAQRATELIDRLKQNVPEERLVVREYDVVETKHSKISGHLRATSLLVETTEFGPQQLRLSDMRALRSQRAPADAFAYIKPLPDPGTMGAYTGQLGKTFCFTVSARVNGSIYGTGVYTYDTPISAAAIHAGVLKPGETADIRVTMLGPVPGFTASTQNGITSNAYSAYPAGYKFAGKQAKLE